MLFDDLSRDIVRLLHFPGDDDYTYQYPTPSRISSKLGVNFNVVKRRLEDMKESGFISEKLSMTLNLGYLGMEKYILLGMVPTNDVMKIYEEVKRNPPSFLESFYRANVGPPTENSMVVMEVLSKERELNEKLEYLALKYKNLSILDNSIVKCSFELVTPENSHERRTLENLRDGNSLERRILRTLWEDTSLTVPDIADRVYPGGMGPTKYRTVKRTLDDLVKLRAFWLFPQIDSTKIKGKMMIALTVMILNEGKASTIAKIRKVLSKNYIMYRNYYSDWIPVGCIYEGRKDYLDTLESLSKEGLSYAVFEDFYGFSTGVWPLQ